jgi:hypothetical protein
MSSLLEKTKHQQHPPKNRAVLSQFHFTKVRIHWIGSKNETMSGKWSTPVKPSSTKASPGRTPNRRYKSAQKKSATPTQRKNPNAAPVNCCICGKDVNPTAKTKFPERWPQHLRVYTGQLCHRKCLDMMRNLRTEYQSGFIHKKWDLNGGPLVGAKARDSPGHVRVRLTKPLHGHGSPKRKPFCSTVQQPTPLLSP